MKKLLFAIITAAAIINASSLSSVAENSTATKVVAYYFHGTMRCPTCYKLEQYSKEAIEANFKDALASGKLEFKVINVEDKGNEHFTKDYQLYTKSLVISLIQNGKEIKSKNLTKIWDYVGNKQKFFDYVTGEIKDFLKGS